VGIRVGVGGTVFVGKGVKVGRAVLGGGAVVADLTSVVGIGVNVGPLHAVMVNNMATRTICQMIRGGRNKARTHLTFIQYGSST
jgi:hypothetical protein